MIDTKERITERAADGKAVPTVQLWRSLYFTRSGKTVLDADELVEKRLLAQLVEVNTSIAHLSAEKAALERLIIRIREKKVRITDVTRSNSIDRILVEDKIREILIRYKTPVYGRYMFSEIKSIFPEINNSTFRSHLHRMKSKGVIANSNKRGFWVLVESGAA